MIVSPPGKYYGSKKLEYKSAGIVLSEYEYKEAFTPWHYHENPYFMYILKGNLLDFNKRGRVECPAGSLIFHNWQEAHYNSRQTENSRGFHVEMERSWILRYQPETTLWEGSQLVQNPRVHHLLAMIYLEFLCYDWYSELAIDLLLLQICDHLNNEQPLSCTHHPQWISRLKELVHQNEIPLTLDSLSAVLGIHPVHLSRAVPKYLSTTLGEYIRQYKIKMALKDLMDPAFSLTEIAYRCGFADQSHFIRIFQRFFNLTPGAYRNLISRG